MVMLINHQPTTVVLGTKNTAHIVDKKYLVEIQKCSDIAQRLDSLNPTLPGAFIGTPSERIRNQLKSMNVDI